MRIRVRVVLIAGLLALAGLESAAAPAAAAPASRIATGITHYRRGRLAAAEAAFRAETRAYPRSARARLWLGVTLYARHRYDDASTTFAQAVALAPRDPHGWLWWGYALARRGEPERARLALTRALVLAPKMRAGDLALAGMRALRPLPTVRSEAGPAVRRPGTYRDLARLYNPRLTNDEATLIGQAIVGYSARFNLDPRLVVAVIVIESGFAPTARSPKGAMGLGQLMPATAASLGVSAFDPVQNVYGTVRVLRGNLDHFGWHNAHLALAAYNAGKGAVHRHGGIPPYPETQWYVHNVTTLYRRMLRAYAAETPRGYAAGTASVEFPAGLSGPPAG